MASRIAELYKPIIDKFECLLAPNIVNEIEESLVDCYATCTNITGVEGMKLAISIICINPTFIFRSFLSPL